MDPILLDEILRSLRLIRDEISHLREKDSAKRVLIDALEYDVQQLEMKMQPLIAQASRMEGAKTTATVISSIIGAIVGFVFSAISVWISVKGG